ncbi:hypothetical protein, partial [Mucilaginibacter sp.]|uniref:hypothetical protein n=1 Tax=Mucilaginibacter sp. TaxID=1882438 RepID=UPI0035BC05F2
MDTFFLRGILSRIIIISIATACILSCNGGPEKGKVYRTIESDKSVKPTFKQHWGKSFTEVKRTFKNGIAFSEYGYQLQPEWRFKFLNDDSVNIYNPVNKTWGNAPMQFDHDSIFNIAWAYMRLQKQTKDSIQFQVLKVEGR